MAVGNHTGSLQYGGNAAAYLGNFTDRCGVGCGGVETQKAGFTDDLACRIKAFDGHVVQPGRAVHGGARHGLGYQYQLGGLHQRQGFGGQAGFGRARRSPKNAQAGFGFGNQTHHVAVALEVVVARAEEGEVAVFQPAQEVHAFLAPGWRQRGTGCSRSHGLGAFQHGLPVLNGCAHIA